ncbi:MAG: adenosylcobinamide-GDP ribazoletransferase [Caldilineaceae bacterium]|nr:adenosylcobinamide-GDP ribazoletransferase [Caldilineaceae bacterium]
MYSLRIALSFLTTMPLPSLPAEAFLSGQGRAFAWYPAVGLLIGLLLSGAAFLLAQAALSPQVQSGLLLLGWVLITGGLHLDGVMDSCDALFAPVSVARRLAILKDVHTGAFGVLGLFFVLGLKWALLAELLGQPGGWLTLHPALLLAPLWGRWVLVWAAWRFPYARPGESLGRTMTGGLSRREALIATLTALAIHSGLAFWQPDLWAVVLVVPLVYLLARWAAGKLGGGLTGDLYGFLCETTEGLVLLALVLLGGAIPV